MKKHKFKDGDGVLSTSTTREQRAEILKYAYENGYEVYFETWREEEGYISYDDTICFDGDCFIGCDDSEVTNPMSYPEIMTKINPEWLIGKKCKGFTFKSTDSLPYSDNMNEYVGKVGEIKVVKGEIFKLKFEDDFWIYPLSEIHKHLIDEDNLFDFETNIEIQTNKSKYFDLQEEIFQECKDIGKKKNSDYAEDNDPYKNFRKCETIGVSTEKGILVRMLDKISRIDNYIDNGELKVKDESIKDTIIDIINYSTLLYGVIKERQEENER